MSEIIKAKYIDLMVDWSFKRVFGTEVNKDILIEFLKVVFPQFAITDITYIPTEHRYQLLETKTLKRMTDKLEFVFVEVAKFDKSEDELETDLDKWLYLLKNMSKLLERPAALRDRVFGRLFDVAEYARLDDEERKNYVESMNTARDTYNQIDYALNKGIGIGREEGIEIGREKKAYEIARNLLAMKLDIDSISKATGLTKEEVAKLAEQ